MKSEVISLSSSLSALSFLSFVLSHQNVPPGMNPNIYKQQVPHHVPQQVPVAGGHPPQQHPPQQQQQQHFAREQHILDAKNIEHEKDHIADHLDVPIDTSKMSEQELQFHYFKMNDADNNDKLDGCELIKSLIHWHEQGHRDPTTGTVTGAQEKVFGDEELASLIDPILATDDANRDGFINYPEFVHAQQKAFNQQQAQQGAHSP